MPCFRSSAAALLAVALLASACDDNTPSAPLTPDPPAAPPPPATVSSGTLRRSLPGATGLATVTAFVFTAEGFASSDAGALTYHWDFGDGQTSVGGAAVSHVYGGAGLFDVRVIASNAAGRTAEANVPAVRVTTVTGRWTSRLAISSGIITFDMTQVGPEIQGVSDYYGSGRSVLTGRLTSPAHLDLTLTVPPGLGGVSNPFSFPFALDANATVNSLSGTLTGPYFCPCATILTRQ